MTPSQELPPRGPLMVSVVCALIILLTLIPISTNEEIKLCNDSIYCGKKIKIYKSLFYIVFLIS